MSNPTWTRERPIVVGWTRKRRVGKVAQTKVVKAMLKRLGL